MKHIVTIAGPSIRRGEHTGCGECQASCQSACKTSCTVANQKCQNKGERIRAQELKQGQLA